MDANDTYSAAAAVGTPTAADLVGRTDRERRLRQGSVAAILARVVALLVGLVSVPLLLGHLGEQRFGVWATITSFTMLLTFADLGLSNGIVNSVVDAEARGNRERIAQDVSSVVFLLAVVGVGVLAASLVLDRLVDVSTLIGQKGDVPATEIKAGLLVFVVCFALSLPLGVVVRIQMGYQESGQAYLWVALGSVFGLIGMVLAVTYTDSLAPVITATVGGPVLAAALNAGMLFGFRRTWLRPRLRLASWESASALLRTGALWFALQCSTAVAYQSDFLVISHVLGAAAVTDYTVPMRLFVFMPAVLSVALSPLWPAVRSAIESGDLDWAKHAYRRMMALGAVGVLVPTAGLVFAAPTLIDAWTGGKVETDQTLLIVLALWAVTTCVVTPIAFLLAGANALGFQVLTNAVMAVVNVGLSIPLAHWLGIEGVVLGTVVANVLCIIVPSLIFVPRLLERLDEGSADARRAG